MPKIVWDGLGTRYYETGIDQGVLYVDGQPGIPWNGLTSVTKSPSGGDAQPFYVDGVKYSNNSSAEEFEASITAITYPDEFEACDGSAEPRPGMFLTGQKRKSFGLAYRSTVGNDLSSKDYRINLVYNATVAPTARDNKTQTDSVDVMEFSWKVTTLPPTINGFKNSALVILDSRFIDPDVLSGIEDILYGTDMITPRLPEFAELVDLYDTENVLVVTDNGDGTYTMTAPLYAMYMLDANVFQLTWDTAINVDDNTITVTSGS